jgi:hypothetical protein
MSIKQAIESLPPLPEFTGWIGANDQDPDAGEMGYTADQMREYAIAALRSMPAEPVAWMWEHVLNDTGVVRSTGLSLNKVDPTNNTFFDGSTSTRVTPLYVTPHTEAVRMSEAEIEGLYPTVKIGDEKPVRLVWFTRNDVMKTARAVEQATAARLGVKMGDV